MISSKGEFWKDWEKPWTEEQTKQVYIQSVKRFTIDDIVKAAGVSKTTFYNWQKTREEDWAQLRDEYFKKLHLKAQEASIKKSAEYLAKEFQKQLDYHFESARNYNEVLRIHSLGLKLEFQQYYQDFIDKKINLEKFVAKIKSLKGIEMLNFATALQRLIESERQALGLDYYQSLDKSTQALESAGYVVMSKEDYDAVVSDTDAESEVE